MYSNYHENTVKILGIASVSEKISEQYLLTLFLAFYQKVDGQLSPYAFWALLKFVRNFRVESTSLPLAELSKVIGIQVKKLGGVLDELEQREILMISFPESGKRARVRHLQLRLAYIEAIIESPDWLEQIHKRQNRQISLLQLIKILFIKSDGISISNLPPNLELNYGLDYRSYLVLLRLLYGADLFGIVIGCGIAEIERATGLNKQSIYRTIQQLKEFGFIRSQANGAIRNSFIQTESPIYALNLSHTFWGDAAIYGKFYILKYPQPHVFEVQKVASMFTVLDQKSDLLLNDGKDNSKTGLEVLKYKNNYLLHDPLCWMKPILYKKNNDFDVIQRAEVMKFFDHYLELKQLRPENPLSTTFNLKPHENILKDEEVLDHSESIQHLKLSGMRNRLGLFQSLIEQWCCQIYSKNISLFKMLRDANLAVIDDESFERLGCTDFLYPYSLQANQNKIINEDISLKNESDKNKSIKFRLKFEQSRVHQFLMALMDLIAYNQIYFFQQCMRKHSDIDQKLNAAKNSLERVFVDAGEIVVPFRILPRSFIQNTYSCYFVPDQHTKADKYFLCELEFRKPLQDGTPFDFPTQQMTEISPTLKELKDYGLLHHSCLSLFE
jgi:DNA-binding MarR family transcriptional regulator